MSFKIKSSVANNVNFNNFLFRDESGNLDIQASCNDFAVEMQKEADRINNIFKTSFDAIHNLLSKNPTKLISTAICKSAIKNALESKDLTISWADFNLFMKIMTEKNILVSCSYGRSGGIQLYSNAVKILGEEKILECKSSKC